jgi:HK97 family phage major capsid protein
MADKFAALRKALGVVPDDTGEDYLPKPLADEMVNYIQERNWIRQLVGGVTMTAKTLTLPTVHKGDTGNVYLLGAGVDVSAGGRSELKPSSKAVVLNAKKFMAWATNDTEDQEDGALDAAELIMQNFADCFAAAEEEAMLIGDVDTYGATTNHLGAFDGLYTIAADSGKVTTTPVTYAGSDRQDVVDAVADAIKELGLHGRDKGQLCLLVSSVLANRLRKQDPLNQALQYGAATQIQQGTLVPVHGIKVIETTFLDSKESGEVGILFNTTYPVVGDRRRIKVVNDPVPLSDLDRWVITERLDFKVRQQDVNGKAEGIVLIHKETT